MSPQSLLFIPPEHLSKAYGSHGASPRGEVFERRGALVVAALTLALAVAVGLF